MVLLLVNDREMPSVNTSSSRLFRSKPGTFLGEQIALFFASIAELAGQDSMQAVS